MQPIGTMKIMLEQEWLGTPKGSVIDVVNGVARQLIEREVAKEVTDKMLKARSEKIITKEVK
jgi:hypothetical protein